MKKFLLTVLGAALLMVGCTKEIETSVNDINSRLTALEDQVAANKAAIEALQKASFISNVEQTETGWTITLNNNQVITLYNGAAGAQGPQGPQGPEGAKGADGDAFFKSVSVDGELVTITLNDEAGTTYVLPLYVEFGLELLMDDVAVKPSATVSIPYKLVGATAQTKLYVIAGGSYTAKVDEVNEVVVIETPAVLDPNSIIIIADRGDGKSAIKAINLEGQEVSISAPAAAFGYWDDKDFKVKVVSNTPVTISTDVPWLTIKDVKSSVTYDVTAHVTTSPTCLARTGHVIVRDAIGTVIQSLAVTQTGVGQFFLNNVTSYATWAAAATALATAEAKAGGIIDADGLVRVIISQDAVVDRIVLPENEAIKKIEVMPRFYGVPAADPTKIIVKGITIPGGVEANIHDVVIRPDGTGKLDDLNPGYATGVAIRKNSSVANKVTINNVVFDGTDENYTATTPTMVFDNGSIDGSVITISNCRADFGGCRGFQFYGAGKYTLDHNILSNAYSSYMGRLYGTVDVTLTNNVFDSNNLFNLYVVGPTVTPAIVVDASCKLTSEDSNTYTDNVTRVYTGHTQIASGGVADPAGEASIYPAAKGGAGIVTLDGIKYATVSAALANAANGAVVEIAEGEIDDNIKIPAGKNYTIKAAAGAVRDKVIVNGNIEVAGSATISGITVKTKAGLTDNSVSVSPSDDPYNWSHAYLIRLENGAKDVTIENVRFVATEALAGPGASGAQTPFKDGLTELFIAQSKNVKVLNCVFDSSVDGAYCNNQTYASEVEFRGNVFNVGGKKTYASRISVNSIVTYSGNEFNTKFGIDFYNFTGALILGDGVEDDNHYMGVVTNALNSAEDKYTVLSNGATILPVTVTFNAPTTAPAKDPEIALIWKHIDDEAWNATVDIANVRNVTMNEKAMYLPQTGGHVYTLSLEDGSVVKDQEVPGTGGHWAGYCGAYSLSDGTILLASGAINSGAHFLVSTYDGANLKTVVDFVNDGTYRLGDHFTAVGTKDDFTVYAVDYKKGADNSGRYLAFNYKGGDALTTFTDSVKISGMPSNANMAEMTPFAAGKYYLQLEGGKNDYIVTDGATGANAAEIALGDLNADVNKRMTRGAKFFTAGGKNYMAFVEFITYDGGYGRGGRVHVYALPTNNPEVDLKGATAVATYDLPTNTGSGNAQASFMVTKVGAKVYFGVGLRAAGVALLEFKY